jgi:hypothetical protein
VDLDFSAQAPTGQEGSWILTHPRGLFEVVFRFCGPQKIALFDKEWKLPDVHLESQ